MKKIEIDHSQSNTVKKHETNLYAFTKKERPYIREIYGKKYKSILPYNYFVPFSSIKNHDSELLPRNIFVDSVDHVGHEKYMYENYRFMLINMGKKLRIWIIDNSLYGPKIYSSLNSIKTQILLKLYKAKDIEFCNYIYPDANVKNLAYSITTNHGSIDMLIRSALLRDTFAYNIAKMYVRFSNEFNMLGVKINPKVSMPSDITDLIVPFTDNSYVNIKNNKATDITIAKLS